MPSSCSLLKHTLFSVINSPVLLSVREVCSSSNASSHPLKENRYSGHLVQVLGWPAYFHSRFGGREACAETIGCIKIPHNGTHALV